MDVQSPGEQRPQEDGQHLLALRVRLDQAQEVLLALHCHAQRDDHRRIREPLPIQKHGHVVVGGKIAFLEGAQLLSADRRWVRRGRSRPAPPRRARSRAHRSARDPAA